jgi:hypothetical protein
LTWSVVVDPPSPVLSAGDGRALVAVLAHGVSFLLALNARLAWQQKPD